MFVEIKLRQLDAINPLVLWMQQIDGNREDPFAHIHQLNALEHLDSRGVFKINRSCSHRLTSLV